MKRYLHPLYNKNDTIFEAICDMQNLELAHRHAKRGKGWYKEVKQIEENVPFYLSQLQTMLKEKTYHTSEYLTFAKVDSGKERVIYKLPYFPDRVCQWAVMQIIEPILMRKFTKDTYSAIPGRGIHQCLRRMKKALRQDAKGTQYCLKIDVKKYYPSIDHSILKQKYRKLFKDEELLWLLDEIIDSTSDGEGIPIGNYLSQYSGNFYLSDFDHWIKEVKGVKYYYRYMDDIVILHSSKLFLRQLFCDIEAYFKNELHLTIKKNWQIFMSKSRGIDYVGYRIFGDFVLLRKRSCKTMKCKMRNLQKKEKLTYEDGCSVASYMGWLRHCDGYRLTNKYVLPVMRLQN